MATKTKTQLTQAKATSQAASRVRQVMAGALITAQTRGSYDLTANKALYITTITYPPAHPAAVDARAALMRIPGVRSVEMNAGYATIVRER